MKKTFSKLTSVVLALVIAASLMVTAFAAYYGDLNEDNNVNSTDALIILRYSVGQLTEINETAADVNHDGKINSTDALAVLRISVGQGQPEEIPEETPSAPASKAEIVEFYNNAVNKVVTDKAGYTKQRTTTVTHLDAGKYTDMAGDIVKEFLGEGTSEFKNTKGSSKYLVKSSLTADDVTSATCQQTGLNYTITLELKNGSSSYTSKKTADNSPIARTGLLAGNQLNPEYDYLNSANIYAGVKSKGAKANSINAETTNAKIVITVDAKTGNMLSYTLSFDWKVDIDSISVLLIKVPTATGNAHTAVVISDFKW